MRYAQLASRARRIKIFSSYGMYMPPAVTAHARMHICVEQVRQSLCDSTMPNLSICFIFAFLN